MRLRPGPLLQRSPRRRGGRKTASQSQTSEAFRLILNLESGTFKADVKRSVPPAHPPSAIPADQTAASKNPARDSVPPAATPHPAATAPPPTTSPAPAPPAPRPHRAQTAPSAPSLSSHRAENNRECFAHYSPAETPSSPTPAPAFSPINSTAPFE